MNPVPASLMSLILLAPAVDGWLGVYLDNERTEAVIAEVIPDTPAAKAGLRAGDIAVAVGDRATPTREEFIAAVRAGKIGERLSIRVRRTDGEVTVVVTLGQRPEGISVPPAPKPGAGAPSGGTQGTGSPPTRSAPAVEAAPTKGRGYLGVSVRDDEGVQIDRVLPDGPAKIAGIVSGDRIVSVNDRPIGSVQELDAVLDGSPAGSKLTIGLRSDAGTRSVTLTLARPPAALQNQSERTGRAMPREGSAGIGVATPSAPTTREAAPRDGSSGARPAPREAAGDGDVEAEIAKLRAELAELRRQVEELRQRTGRE